MRYGHIDTRTNSFLRNCLSKDVNAMYLCTWLLFFPSDVADLHTFGIIADSVAKVFESECRPSLATASHKSRNNCYEFSGGKPSLSKPSKWDDRSASNPAVATERHWIKCASKTWFAPPVWLCIPTWHTSCSCSLSGWLLCCLVT